jgi:hypothetical protein
MPPWAAQNRVQTIFSLVFCRFMCGPILTSVFPQVQGLSHGKSSGVLEVADAWGLATRSLDPCKMNQTD